MKTFQYQGTGLESYGTYRKSAGDGLTIEEADRIFTEYYQSLDFSDEFFCEEYAQLVSDAIRYSQMRANWACMDREERMREDEMRTNAHNMLINDVSRYAGYLKRNGIAAPWFEELAQGVEPEKLDRKRKRIGDWGCYIALFAALNNR